MAGVFLVRGTCVPDRVAVFVDYQNVYMEARRVFGLQHEPAPAGQIKPNLAGRALTRMGVGDRVLSEVRIYRGFPSTKYDQKGYDACLRQVSIWRQRPDVTVTTRTLNYRDPDFPREKGIDVALAVDFVRLAIEGAYDVGVMFSHDTDLLPALGGWCLSRA
jgi:uncharacterized LabA/DUF88 family protein